MKCCHVLAACARLWERLSGVTVAVCRTNKLPRQLCVRRPGSLADPTAPDQFVGPLAGRLGAVLLVNVVEERLLR